ncbi:hypothetical protein J6590_058688 [Homalodisca vitripennis]|nr:hypothetical protein J6590_058688 [Homalodisca vitripennis]
MIGFEGKAYTETSVLDSCIDSSKVFNTCFLLPFYWNTMDRRLFPSKGNRRGCLLHEAQMIPECDFLGLGVKASEGRCEKHQHRLVNGKKSLREHMVPLDRALPVRGGPSVDPHKSCLKCERVAQKARVGLTEFPS